MRPLPLLVTILISITSFALFTAPLVFANNINASLDLSAGFKEKMDYAKAIAVLKEAASQSADTKANQLLGRLYYLSGDYVKALEVFANLKSKDWLDFVYLGLIYEDTNKPAYAVNSYLHSLKLKENTVARYRLGKIFYRQKQYNKAARFFSGVLAGDSSIRLANYYLSECFLKIGDYKKAYNYSARGINFYPDNLAVKKQLAEVKSKLGSNFFRDIKQTIEKARALAKSFFYEKSKSSPLVNVGIAKDLKDLDFKNNSDFTISDGKKIFKAEKNRFYRFIWHNGRIFLTDRDKKIIYAKFKNELSIKNNGYPFYILDVAYGRGNYWHKKIDRAYRGELKLLAGASGITLINILNVEDYLYGVLPAEILPSTASEALKAQAVAARTLVLQHLGKRHKIEGFDVCADVHCQVYQGISAEAVPTNKAIDETSAEVLFYKSTPIEAVYHNNCGGCLRADTFGPNEYFVNKFDGPQKFFDKFKGDAKEKFSKMPPYEEELWFTSEPQSFCSYAGGAKYRWQRIYDAEDFLLAFDFPLSDLEKILPVDRGECPYYKSIEVVKTTGKLNITGDLKIRDYFDRLRSTSFKAEIKFSPKQKAQMLIFWGAGFGHGMGMCQAGAEGMAKEGYSYREILEHYYPNTKLKRAY